MALSKAQYLPVTLLAGPIRTYPSTLQNIKLWVMLSHIFVRACLSGVGVTRHSLARCTDCILGDREGCVMKLGSCTLCSHHLSHRTLSYPLLNLLTEGRSN